MACRDGFLKLACKVILLYGGRRQMSWILGRFLLVHFFHVLAESLMLVCDFLLSSATVGYVDSDSASLSFWKISGEKIERRLGRTHGHEKIWNFWKFEKIAEIWFWKLISLAFSNCGIEMIAVAIFKMLRTRKIAKKLDSWSLVDPKICSGPALRAVFRILMQPRVNL